MKIISLFLIQFLLASLVWADPSSSFDEEEDGPPRSTSYQGEVLERVYNHKTEKEKDKESDKKRREKLQRVLNTHIQTLIVEDAKDFVEKLVNIELVPLKDKLETTKDPIAAQRIRDKALEVVEVAILQAIATHSFKGDALQKKANWKFNLRGGAISLVGLGPAALFFVTMPDTSRPAVVIGTLLGATARALYQMGKAKSIGLIKKKLIESPNQDDGAQVLLHFEKYLRQKNISLEQDFGISFLDTLSELVVLQFVGPNLTAKFNQICTRYLTESKVNGGPRVETYRGQLRIGGMDPDLSHMAAAQELEATQNQIKKTSK